MKKKIAAFTLRWILTKNFPLKIEVRLNVCIRTVPVKKILLFNIFDTIPFIIYLIDPKTFVQIYNDQFIALGE